MRAHILLMYFKAILTARFFVACNMTLQAASRSVRPSPDSCLKVSFNDLKAFPTIPRSFKTFLFACSSVCPSARFFSESTHPWQLFQVFTSSFFAALLTSPAQWTKKLSFYCHYPTERITWYVGRDTRIIIKRHNQLILCVSPSGYRYLETYRTDPPTRCGRTVAHVASCMIN